MFGIRLLKIDLWGIEPLKGIKGTHQDMKE
jgi:hypothetical protein